MLWVQIVGCYKSLKRRRTDSNLRCRKQQRQINTVNKHMWNNWWWNVYLCKLDEQNITTSKKWLEAILEAPPALSARWIPIRCSDFRVGHKKPCGFISWIETHRIFMAELLLMATRNPVNSPVEVGSLSHDFQGLIHARDQGINLQ